MGETNLYSYSKDQYWITGYKETKIGKVPIISTGLVGRDILGGIRVRVKGSMRDTYRIRPGLYCAGNPDEHSPVLVTANYKLTFDNFRKELNGIDCWILVIDSKGINVWCAAGKGTFGTSGVIEWIRTAGLRDLVDHNTIILPQLGAPGVSAHIVKKETGFRVVYGPVRARDIAAFLENKLKKDKKMRTVEFKLKDRLVLVPLEFMVSLPVLVVAFILIFIADWIFSGSIDLKKTLLDYIPFASAVIAGSVIVPILLPYIPVRSFIVKGMLAGVVLAVIINIAYRPTVLSGIAYFINITTTSSILALAFIGATTFTSVSGVTREVKVKLFVLFPLLFASIAIGLASKIFAV